MHRSEPPAPPPPGPPLRLTLPFDRPPILANEARSGAAHYHAQARAKRDVAAAVIAGIRKAGVTAVHGPVRATLVWELPDDRAMDAGALSWMIKACLDACTPARDPIPAGAPLANGKGVRKRPHPGKAGAGVIRDDDARIVRSETVEVIKQAARLRMVFRLDPIVD